MCVTTCPDLHSVAAAVLRHLFEKNTCRSLPVSGKHVGRRRRNDDDKWQVGDGQIQQQEIGHRASDTKTTTAMTETMTPGISDNLTASKRRMRTVIPFPAAESGNWSPCACALWTRWRRWRDCFRWRRGVSRRRRESEPPLRTRQTWKHHHRLSAPPWRSSCRKSTASSFPPSPSSSSYRKQCFPKPINITTPARLLRHPSRSLVSPVRAHETGPRMG